LGSDADVEEAVLALIDVAAVDGGFVDLEDVGGYPDQFASEEDVVDQIGVRIALDPRIAGGDEILVYSNLYHDVHLCKRVSSTLPVA